MFLAKCSPCDELKSHPNDADFVIKTNPLLTAWKLCCASKHDKFGSTRSSMCCSRSTSHVSNVLETWILLELVRPQRSRDFWRNTTYWWWRSGLSPTSLLIVDLHFDRQRLPRKQLKRPNYFFTWVLDVWVRDRIADILISLLSSNPYSWPTLISKLLKPLLVLNCHCACSKLLWASLLPMTIFGWPSSTISTLLLMVYGLAWLTSTDRVMLLCREGEPSSLLWSSISPSTRVANIRQCNCL